MKVAYLFVHLNSSVNFVVYALIREDNLFVLKSNVCSVVAIQSNRLSLLSVLWRIFHDGVVADLRGKLFCNRDSTH